MAKWGEIKGTNCATLEERLEAALQDADEAEAYAEELEAHCKRLRLEAAHAIEWLKRLADDLNAAEGREARLKDKLEKAVEVLEQCEIMLRLRGHDEVAAIARTTLAELTGDKDD